MVLLRSVYLHQENHFAYLWFLPIQDSGAWSYLQKIVRPAHPRVSRLQNKFVSSKSNNKISNAFPPSAKFAWSIYNQNQRAQVHIQTHIQITWQHNQNKPHKHQASQSPQPPRDHRAISANATTATHLHIIKTTSVTKVTESGNNYIANIKLTDGLE